jgi:hypothetical protein
VVDGKLAGSGENRKLQKKEKIGKNGERVERKIKIYEVMHKKGVFRSNKYNTTSLFFNLLELLFWPLHFHFLVIQFMFLLFLSFFPTI